MEKGAELAPAPTQPACAIKGNILRKGDKIHHLPGTRDPGPGTRDPGLRPDRRHPISRIAPQIGGQGRWHSALLIGRQYLGFCQ